VKIAVTKDLAPLRASAAQRIAELATANRAAYATPGKDAVYMAKRDEALRWFAAGGPTDLTGFPYLQGEVGVTEPTAQQLAQVWTMRNDLWMSVIAPKIERQEHTAKRAIAQAATPAEIEAVVENWVAV
jgi:hypothetical protein